MADPRDPYVDERGVLKNKLNIHDNTELQKSEANIAYSKMMDIRSVYQGKLDAELFKNLHRHLFGDI
jgi:fido (protein-threonine AMPylation protein)